MKRIFLYIVLAFSFIGATSSQAIELVPITSFDNTWVQTPYGSGIGAASASGGQINLSSQGTSQYYEIDFSGNGAGIVGMAATISVKNLSTNASDDTFGIAQNVAQIGNSSIQLTIRLVSYNSQHYIEYRVRATDLTTGDRTTLIDGVFGDYTGGWNVGDSKTVAFALVGSEFWFYMEGSPLVKVQSYDSLTPYYGQPTAYAYADPGTSISGTISNVFLIH